MAIICMQEASFAFSTIEEDMVRKILCNLNVRKATGTSGVAKVGPGRA